MELLAVALAFLAVALALALLLSVRSHAALMRQSARREAQLTRQVEDLLNRVMYMAERPWQTPVDHPVTIPEEEMFDPDLILTPEASVIEEP